ncbi:MAG: hypothetical protein Q7R53_00280 [bacterium]|nr:hypothetical protein [bacterium]
MNMSLFPHRGKNIVLYAIILSIVEKLSTAQNEIQFSSRFLGNLKPKNDNHSGDENGINLLPNCRIIYERTGNLSTTTQLDQDKADKFMLASDMRRNILVVDSDVRKETEVVSVSSDILAFRAIEPIRRLTEIRFRPKPFHTLNKWDRSFEIQVHERAIDDKVRSNHPIDSSDYKNQFLKMLNVAIKSGVAESLFQEKLGFGDQWRNYSVQLLANTIFAPLIISSTTEAKGALVWSSLFLMYNLYCNFRLYEKAIEIKQLYPKLTLPPWIPTRKPWEMFLPTLPVDKWILGRIYLSKHGSNLVVPKNL